MIDDKNNASQQKQETKIDIIKWETDEYEHNPKSDSWLWVIAIITAGLAIASILLKNILFAILLALAGFTIILYSKRPPRKILFSITGRGIQIENRVYFYENLQSFWIHYDPPHKKILTIKPKKLLVPLISMPFDNANPNDIRLLLLKFLKEEKHEEPAIATISRLFKF